MKRIIKPLITATLLLGSIATFFFSGSGFPSTTDHTTTKLTANGVAIAPFFIANNGQIDDTIHFYVKGSQHSYFLRENGEAITRSIYKEKEETTKESNTPLPGIDTAHAKTVREVGFSQSFVGANKGILPTAGDRAVPTLNFFTDAQNITEVPTYSSLTYTNLYHGIDLTYKVSKENKIKYDLIVNPGSDPARIIMKFDGIQDLSVDAQGNLQMKTPAQTFTQHKPYIYQIMNGREQPVEGSYQVNTQNNTVAFAIPSYDHSLPLVIDPVLDQLGASTFYGGSGQDFIYDLTRNSSDQIYVTGFTDDSTTDLPVIVGGYDTTHNGDEDAFVARFDNNLEDLTYATYIGGSNADRGSNIALDSNGKVVIVGHTINGSGYPTTTATYSSSSTGGWDVFVSRFSATLANLETSVRFGGSDLDQTYQLYIDSSNNIYISGYTASTNFPEVNGNYQSSYGGGTYDVFVAKLPSNLGSLESTYLGGTSGDYIDDSGGLVVDSSGYVYTGGYTFSTNFPTTSAAFDTSFNGNDYEGFISKFSSDLTSLSASTLIGTGGGTRVTDLALDSSGALYTSLVTANSTVTTTSGVLQTAESKGYIGKFASNLQTLSIGTYFGGSSANVYPYALVLDSSNNVYVAGAVSSTFATTSGAYDTSYNGGAYDGFISKITANLVTLSESTYIGGSGDDRIYALALNADQDNLFIAGFTEDSTTDFPTTGDAYDTTHNGGPRDGFISIMGAISGGVQGGGSGATPEFSTFIYMLTLAWCGYLLYSKFSPHTA